MTFNLCFLLSKFYFLILIVECSTLYTPSTISKFKFGKRKSFTKSDDFLPEGDRGGFISDS